MINFLTSSWTRKGELEHQNEERMHQLEEVRSVRDGAKRTDEPQPLTSTGGTTVQGRNNKGNNANLNAKVDGTSQADSDNLKEVSEPPTEESVYLSAGKFIDVNVRCNSNELNSSSDLSYGSSGDDSINPVLTESESDDNSKHTDDLIAELRTLTAKSKTDKTHFIKRWNKRKQRLRPSQAAFN